MRPYLYLALSLLLALAPATTQAISAPAATVDTPVAHATTAPTATRQSKRLARKEARQQRRELRRDLREAIRNSAADDNTILLVIVALFIPPLAVFLYEDDITNKFWISLLLTFLFFLPGVIYSILVVTGKV